MKERLKVLCVGTGYFSQFHYEAWSRLPNAIIAGVCNRSLDKAKDFARTYKIEHAGSDLQCMIDQCTPDIIDVITPPHTHLEAVKIAAKNGVNVICQKPFGENIYQAKEMVEIAEKASIDLIIHENFRFMPWFRKIKKLLDEGLLGDVLNMTFRLRPGDGQGAEAYLERQPYFQTMPKFLVHETAIHLVDTFRYLFGEPLSLYAQLRKCNPVIKGEDSGIVVFEFENNIQGVFDGNRLLDHSASNTRRTMGEFDISGTAGELRLDGEGVISFRAFGKRDFNNIEYDFNDANFGGDCVFNTIEHIAQHYLTGTPIENTGAQYLQNIEIEKHIYDSSDSGRKISL